MKSTRRQLLKAGLLSMGGLTIAPHLSYSEAWRAKPKVDAMGRAIYGPFFKEFVDGAEAPKISAKLNANENPHGPSPMALEAFKEGASLGNRYAWRELFELVDVLAEKEGVTSKNIMMGPGSSDLLEKTGLVLFMNGGNIVSADPAYMSMIKVAESVGAEWKGIPLKSDWSHDLEKMEAAIDKDTKLVYICNPNNPTGSLTDADELLRFCSKVSERVPVFVDEAYLEFLEEKDQKSMVSLVSQGKDVIVARTFSKIHGMAGLRVGYMMGQEKTLDKIRSITRGGMGITYPSVMAASKSLEDVQFQKKSRKLNAEARSYVCTELEKMGFDYVPSYTSFVLFPIEMDGKEFLEKMREKEVAVRAFELMGKNWCRVSMGIMDEMKLFTGVLGSVLS